MSRSIRSVLLLAILTTGAAADENPFEAYEKAGKPGPEHKKLDFMAGEWTWSGKMWVNPEDASKVIDFSGTAVRTWEMGGRFLRDEVASKGPSGDFKGYGLTGYDNTLKKYVGVWVDNMTTGIARSEGTLDKSGKEFTFHTEATDPVLGKTVKGRDEIRIVSDDEHTMTSYKILPDGKEFKVMELVIKKKK